MRLTREEALKRALGLWDEIQNSYLYHERGVESVANLLLAVQSETVEKCCEIANKQSLDRNVDGDRIYRNGWWMSAEMVMADIRAAFPGEEEK